MINGVELSDGYRETIGRLDKILAGEDLNEAQRKAYQKQRDDCVWFIRHLIDEDCV